MKATTGIDAMITAQAMTADGATARVTVQIAETKDEYSFLLPVAEAKRFAVGRRVRLSPKVARDADQ